MVSTLFLCTLSYFSLHNFFFPIFRISDPLIVVLPAISPSGCKKYQTSLNSPVVGAFRDVCKENHIMGM